ncbi:MAG: methyltransferase domain-containing protein [Gammaproteobacteria bacterium]|nr:methyltransferase domain-containing protein [Gammaproteobacteria bacterium]
MSSDNRSRAHDAEYDEQSISFLETLWGEGYLSPGGPEEIRAVLDGTDLRGLKVLDIGCGSGGITLSLAEDYGATRVTGLDVEAPVLARARRRAVERGLDDRVDFIQVEPGPLPFPADSFDVVFSKDSIIHIPDKEALFADVMRILVPGGRLLASDWMIAHDDEPSPEMKRYIEQEGLSFAMASPDRYRRALEAAGFTDVELHNRNPWYVDVARGELAALQGDLYEKAAAAAGREIVDHNIDTWRAMLTVLETGEHCPHHLRGRKPE